MSDSTKEYMFYIIGLLALIIPLLREIFKNKSFIKSKSFKISYTLFLIMSFFILLYLGVDKIDRDSNYRNNSDSKMNSLSIKLDEIQESKTNDSLRYVELKDYLYKNFPFKDSSGFPVYTKEYKNTVNTPRDVYFDQR